MSAAASASGSEDPEPYSRGAPTAPRLWTRAFVDLLIAEALFGFSYALFVLLPKLLAVGYGATAGQIGTVMASFGVASLVDDSADRADREAARQPPHDGRWAPRCSACRRWDSC